MKPCTRCGICCSLSLCSKGRRTDKKKKGNCKYLIKHEDKTTYCQLILEGKMKSKFIAFGEGCFMQERYPLQYQVIVNFRNIGGK